MAHKGCQCCRSEYLMHINQAIRDHETHTSISDLYGVSVDSVQRHAARHIGKPAGMKVNSPLRKKHQAYIERRRYQRRKRQGICIKCSEEASEGIYCVFHAMEHRAQSRAAYEPYRKKKFARRKPSSYSYRLILSEIASKRPPDQASGAAPGRTKPGCC